MVETTAQLETHIQDSRAALDTNLKELEHKVKSVTDWRQHFRNHPGMLLGAALGGGLLLSLMIGNRKARSPADLKTSAPSDLTPSKPSRPQGQVQNDFNDIKTALISLGATQAKDFIGKLIPGFHEHLSQTRREGERSIDEAAKSPIPH